MIIAKENLRPWHTILFLVSFKLTKKAIGIGFTSRKGFGYCCLFHLLSATCQTGFIRYTHWYIRGLRIGYLINRNSPSLSITYYQPPSLLNSPVKTFYSVVYSSLISFRSAN